MAWAFPPFKTGASEPIRIARVLCIFFLVYVHVNPGVSEFNPAVEGIGAFDWLRFTIVNSFGRASVALLSVISGYLIVHSLERAGYGAVLVKRARSLLIPLAIWSAVFLGLVMLGDRVDPGYAAKTLQGDLTLTRLPTLLLGVFGDPANVPLAFLRDVFVCALTVPLLLAALKRSGLLFMLVVLGLFVLGHLSIFLLTPNLLLFFSVGLWFAVSGTVPMDVPRSVFLISLFAFVVLGIVITGWNFDYALDQTATRDLQIEVALSVIRVPAAIVVWSISVWLAHQRFGRALSQFEPYMFIAFCTHMIVLLPVWFIWKGVLGGYYGAAYPVFFFLSPVVVFVSAWIFANIGARIAPSVLKLLNGGRAIQIAPWRAEKP